MIKYAWIEFDLINGRHVTIQDLWVDPDIVLTHDQIELLFRHQCVRCGKRSRVVHELLPRGKAGKKWYHWSNRVVLCAECHQWAHDIGTLKSRQVLAELRDQRIEEIYGPQEQRE